MDAREQVNSHACTGLHITVQFFVASWSFAIALSGAEQTMPKTVGCARRCNILMLGKLDLLTGKPHLKQVF